MKTHNRKGCKCPKGSDIRFCLGKNLDQIELEVLEKVINKHIVALGKRDGVVTFDEVVINVYELKPAILSWHQEEMRKIIEHLKIINSGDPDSRMLSYDPHDQDVYTDGFNQALDDVVKSLSGQEGEE